MGLEAWGRKDGPISSPLGKRKHFFLHRAAGRWRGKLAATSRNARAAAPLAVPPTLPRFVYRRFVATG